MSILLTRKYGKKDALFLSANRSTGLRVASNKSGVSAVSSADCSPGSNNYKQTIL